MTIYIEDLKFQCIIGILDFERVTLQDVIVNITIEYDYQNEFINYADVSKTVKNTMIFQKFELIEEALQNLSLKLTQEFKSIKTLDIKITKPSILPDCKVSVANNYISES